ncbi:MAG TPA: hypothetical protein VIG45_02805 [Erysipelothrix sp.]
MKENEIKIRSTVKKLCKLQNEINSLINEFDSEFYDSGLSLVYQYSDGWVFLNRDTSGNICISDENIRKLASGRNDFQEFN